MDIQNGYKTEIEVTKKTGVKDFRFTIQQRGIQRTTRIK